MDCYVIQFYSWGDSASLQIIVINGDSIFHSYYFCQYIEELASLQWDELLNLCFALVLPLFCLCFTLLPLFLFLSNLCGIACIEMT